MSRNTQFLLGLLLLVAGIYGFIHGLAGILSP